MRLSRIFSPVTIDQRTPLVLTGQAHRHLVKVLRCRVGQMVIVFDGSGGAYRAEVVDINRAQIELNIQDGCVEASEPSLSIEVGIGFLPPKQMDWLIQKSVELGATQLTPLYLEHSKIMPQAPWSIEKKMNHWYGVITHACEQCGRDRLLSCRQPQRLTDWLSVTDTYDWSLQASPDAPTLLTALTGRPQTVRLIIGPEGGFSHQECQQIKAHHFESVSLGPRILRAETAVIVALSLLQSIAGDYQARGTL